MIHFQNYQEYQKYKEELNVWGEDAKDKKTELVIEDNTIYEVDPECMKCLERYRQWKEGRRPK